MSGTNNPPVILELTPELAGFLRENCDSNIALGLILLQRAGSEATAVKLIAMIEGFKGLKQALDKAARL